MITTADDVLTRIRALCSEREQETHWFRRDRKADLYVDKYGDGSLFQIDDIELDPDGDTVITLVD